MDHHHLYFGTLDPKQKELVGEMDIVEDLCDKLYNQSPVDPWRHDLIFPCELVVTSNSYLFLT